MKKFDREFTYKYKSYYDVEVLDYETICQERISGNGSLEKYNCVENQIGTHTEQRVQWNSFDKNVDLSTGNITLGIFTYVLANERVEWIPTLFGVRINEWAEWSEGMNTDLKAYWKLNETSGTVVDSVGGLHNGTNNGAVQGVSGLINGSYDFNSDNDYVELNNTMLGSSFTLNMWVYADSFSNVDYFWSYTNDTVGSPGIYFRYISSGSQIDAIGKDSGGGNTFRMLTPVFSTGSWHMLTLQATNEESGNATIWIDGVPKVSDSSVNYMYGPISSNGHHLGDPGLVVTAQALDGKIDEAGFWDRYLTPAEITQLYNNGTGITYIADKIPPTTTTPTITPSSPTTSNNLECNATLTDDQHTPYDDVNYGNASNATITIGNTAPNSPVQLLPVNESNYAFASTITFRWNNSNDIDPDSPTITYDLEIYNESDMSASNLIHSNTSITEGTDNTSINIKLSDYTTKDDDYYWHVRANDSEDAGSWSDTWEFVYANWTITFNLTDSFSGSQIDTSGPQNLF
jgi:hypothetical protein